MGLYQLFVIIHVVAAILWIGAGTLLQLQAGRANRLGDQDVIKRIIDETSRLGLTFFLPASLAAILSGILAVVTGPWGFGDLWISLGLLGFAATFSSGFFMVRPRADRIAAILKETGGTLTPEALGIGGELIAISRMEFVVLYAVVVDMILKPSIRDLGALGVILVILAAGIGYYIRRLRPAAAPAVG